MKKELFLKIISSHKRTMDELFEEAKNVLKRDEVFTFKVTNESGYIIYVPLFEIEGFRSGCALKHDRPFDYPVAIFHVYKDNELKIEWNYRNTEGDITIFDEDLKSKVDRFESRWNITKHTIEQTVSRCIGVKNPNYKDDGTIESFSLFESEYTNDEEISEKTKTIFENMGYARDEINDIPLKYAPFRNGKNKQVLAYIPVFDRGHDNMGGNCCSMGGYVFIDELY